MTSTTLQPRVVVHYAQTLDGRIATRTGHARWISCDETLRLAHKFRAEHDAVLVGVGTVLADDPQLTVRLVAGSSPHRIILDSALRIPLRSRALTDGAAPTTVVTTSAAPRERQIAVRATGAEVVVVDAGEGGVALPPLLERLGERGIRSLLVEGGAGVITSFLRERLAQRLIVCIAPKISGSGIEAVGNLDILRMGDALRLHDVRVERMGDDLVLDGRLVPTPGSSGD